MLKIILKIDYNITDIKTKGFKLQGGRIMRVDVQGMATDYLPVKSEAVKEIPEEKKAKVGLEDLSTEKKYNIEEIKGAVNEVNQAMEISNYHLKFELYKNSDVYQVKVVDNETNKVIREIPADYMIELSEHIKDTFHKAVGILVNELV